MTTKQGALLAPPGGEPSHLTGPVTVDTGSGTSDYLLANGRDDDVALVDGGRSFTYRDLRAAAAGIAAELVALDLPQGSRIGIAGPNSFFWVAGYLAAMKVGVAVPFSDRLSADEVGRQVAWAGCAAVLLDRRVQRRYADGFPGGVPVVTDEALGGHRPESWPDARVDLDTDAALMFTSGTTARPKAVRVTHRNIVANTASIVSYLRLRSDDKMLVILPFFYCFGLSLLNTHLRVGASLVLCNSFTFPEMAIDLLDSESCTGLAGVPSSFQLLLRASSFGSRALPSLRHLQQAGGKLPPVLVEELLAAKPTARLFTMYGQTEATARLSYLPPELVTEKLGSIGKGIPGVELRVVDEHGREVAPGVTGEIVARGANVSPGYYNDPEASETKFVGGWLRTGDLAVVDDDGFIFVVDRLDDFIKSWGYRVSGQEVEACALRMPELLAAAAIGVPDLEAGEAITLVATARPGATVCAEEVLAFTRQHLPKHMAPHVVHLVDAIPLTASGKVAKEQLRELVASLAPG